MAKHTRWVQFEVPLFVRVELDDEYEKDRVTQVVLALPDEPPYDGIELARDWAGHYLVYDDCPAAEMARASSDDAFGRAAVSTAEYRQGWPAREDWEEGPDPRRFPGLYDDEGSDPNAEGDEDDLEWTSLR
ncbi:MAG TPA: hypothetical protein VKZ82_21195 [Nonomuraea sp.]|uniref:hypothetical protein n=1 Tax=Saccharopolyspora rectivirgula TaxID=28042 RepID=UPI0024093621|nr:hypothetical protein [Saccharopolyspora rectivirgula]HLU74708.1 hypothetical protein [Nonomuraea sp.]